LVLDWPVTMRGEMAIRVRRKRCLNGAPQNQ
jgi:hypothetical protein